jgi:hypothetical protein
MGDPFREDNNWWVRLRHNSRREKYEKVAQRLSIQLAANAYGSTAFHNSVVGTYGWTSRIGRGIERHLNSSANYALSDVCYMLDVPDPTRDRTIVVHRSTAAAAVNRYGIVRLRGPRLVMPEECRVACIDYITDRLKLLVQALTIIAPYPRRRVAREIRDLRYLKSVLKRVVTPPNVTTPMRYQVEAVYREVFGP